jgi:S1-C subfamily serine protease
VVIVTAMPSVAVKAAVVALALFCLTCLWVANCAPQPAAPKAIESNSTRPPAAAPIAAVAAVTPLSQGPAALPPPTDVQHDLHSVIRTIRPAVVSIIAPASRRPLVSQSGAQLLSPFAQADNVVGAGVIIDANGVLVTCLSATRGNSVISVALFRSGSNRVNAERIAVDTQNQLALYQLAFSTPGLAAPIADSNLVRTGDIVLAIGNPFGLAQSVTQGIVSSARRRIALDGVGILDVIQTDSATNSGSCGGPLVNIDGAVIGINAAIYSTDTTFAGISFAIPVNRVRVLYQITTGRFI